MRKIINGRQYDTDTAEEIGYTAANWQDHLYSIFRTLYRKRTGEYFLCEEGGPGTDISTVDSDGTRRGATRITPLTYEAAREWAEKNLEAEEYEKAFGVIDDDNSRTMLSICVSAAAADAARKAAAAQGCSLSAYIEGLIK